MTTDHVNDKIDVVELINGELKNTYKIKVLISFVQHRENSGAHLTMLVAMSAPLFRKL